MDNVTDAVIWLLGRNGYAVTIAEHGENVTATAKHEREPTQTATGTDRYTTVCKLAELCGIELME